MKKFNGALQLPADYLEGWKKQVDVAQQMRDGNFGRLEEPTAKRRFSISRWFRRSAKLEVPDFSHLPLPKPRAVKSPKPEPIGVDSRTLADIADGAHEISLFETEKYLVQRKLEDPVQGLVYVYVQSKEDPAKQLLLRIAKNAHGRDRLFQLNNGYITLKHQRIAHTKIIYQSSEAIITPTGRSFAEWLQEWKQAGTPEHTLEAYALNRLFTRLLQSPYPVQIEQLLASDLIWDGKEWSIENLDSIELGLSADTVSASYQRKVMPAWNLSLEKSCGHWIVRGK